MHVGKQFTFINYVFWTKYELYVMFVVSCIPTLGYFFFHFEFLQKFPYFISTILGTAVAFLISFKNNASYERYKEALRIYENIESASFELGLILNQLKFKNKQTRDKVLSKVINYHCAWLTTLRYRLRNQKVWENLADRGTREFMESFYSIPEYVTPIEEALSRYLSVSEIEDLREQNYHPRKCLSFQYYYVENISENDSSQAALCDNILKKINLLVDYQSDCLRLKEYPYPRNFYAITKYFLYIFLACLPFALTSELASKDIVLLALPLSVLVGWIFICLEKVGQHICFPFEGTVMDVPITAISTDIEIAMKKHCNFKNYPEPVKPMSNFILL